MMRNIDDIYDSIGQNIVGSIPGEWQDACLKVEFYITAMELKATYTTLTDETKDADFDYQIFKDIKELYAIMVEGGDHHKWNRAIFKFSPSNKFGVDFSWDQDLDDELKSLS